MALSMNDIKAREQAQTKADTKPQPYSILIDGPRKYRFTVGKVVDIDSKTGSKQDGDQWEMFEVLIKATNGNGNHTYRTFDGDSLNGIEVGSIVRGVEGKSSAKDQQKAYYNSIALEVLTKKEAAELDKEYAATAITNIADLKEADAKSPRSI